MMIRSLFMLVLALSSLRIAAQSIENINWEIYDAASVYQGSMLFENGTMYVDVGVVVPIASYTLSGNTISVTDTDIETCGNEVGTYSYLIAMDTLHFTLISDACADRAEVFLEYHWLAPASTSISSSFAELELSVHPNPTTGDLFITHASPEQLEINIYDLLGELVHQGRSTGPMVQLQLGDLARGVYVLKAKTGRGMVSKKFMLE